MGKKSFKTVEIWVKIDQKCEKKSMKIFENWVKRPKK